MRRLLLATVAIAAIACAVAPAPVFTPKTAPIAHRGIVIWPGGYTPALLAQLQAWGPLVLRTPVRSRDEADFVLERVTAYPSLSVLVLVEHDSDALVRALADLDDPQLAGIELGNELDLAGLTPWQFGGWLIASYNTLKAGGWSKAIISGGVYALTDDTIQYLHDAMYPTFGSGPWPSDLVVGVHWYQDADDATLARLQRLAAFTSIAITETGMPSRTPAEDDAQAAYLAHMEARAQQLGAAWWIVYQCCSGPSASNLDNFGVFRVDGTRKRFTFGR